MTSWRSLNKRDTEVLETLTLRVRLMSVAQVARTWWGTTKNPLANANRRLEQLETYGMIKRLNVLARPELHLDGPLAAWSPGNPLPDFAALSYRLMKRFEKATAPTPCVIATAQAGHHYGGWGGRHPKNSECTHDIHLTAVYLHFRELHPVRSSCWFSEEWLRRNREAQHERLPDAIIREAGRNTIIEFGGEYPKEKLRSFHDHCAKRKFAYEIW